MLEKVRAACPMRTVIRGVHGQSAPEIGNHPDFSAERKDVRPFLRTVGNLLAKNLPAVQITADGGIGAAFAVFVLVPHFKKTGLRFIHARVDDAGGVKVNIAEKFPVPQVLRDIVQHPARDSPQWPELRLRRKVLYIAFFYK